MNSFIIGLLAIIYTIIVYVVARKVHQRVKKPFTLPVLTVTIFIISSLLLFDISYETYFVGGQWIDKLLGPAIVALAYPLYNNWDLLKQHITPIFSGILVGGVVGVSTGLLFAKWAGFSAEITLSMVPKSITIPVAMDVAHGISGTPALTVIFVIVAGIGGGTLSQYILKLAKIDNYIGRGVGIGSASHAIGTSVAMEMSEQTGAVSAVSMSLSAIIVSFIAPPLVWLIM